MKRGLATCTCIQCVHACRCSGKSDSLHVCQEVDDVLVGVCLLGGDSTCMVIGGHEQMAPSNGSVWIAGRSYQQQKSSSRNHAFWTSLWDGILLSVRHSSSPTCNLIGLHGEGAEVVWSTIVHSPQVACQNHPQSSSCCLGILCMPRKAASSMLHTSGWPRFMILANHPLDAQQCRRRMCPSNMGWSAQGLQSLAGREGKAHLLAGSPVLEQWGRTGLQAPSSTNHKNL